METHVRIDKWLWAVRVFKTRSLATSACRSSRVKIDDKAVKASRAAVPGETITVRKGDYTRIVKVLALLDKRVGAKIVPDYLEDLTPPEPTEQRTRAGERPTKRNRRVIERIMAGE